MGGAPLCFSLARRRGSRNRGRLMSEATSEHVRELEIKIAFLEHHVAQQDRAMMELGRQLDRLERQVTRLSDSVKSADAGASGAMPAGDERPPHY